MFLKNLEFFFSFFFFYNFFFLFLHLSHYKFRNLVNLYYNILLTNVRPSLMQLQYLLHLHPSFLLEVVCSATCRNQAKPILLETPSDFEYIFLAPLVHADEDEKRRRKKEKKKKKKKKRKNKERSGA